MVVAGQLGQHGVVPGPKAHVLLLADDPDGFVVFFQKRQAQLPVHHGPQAAPAQRQHLHPPVREAQLRPGHHRRRVGLHPLGQAREGVLPQQDVRVEDKMVVAGKAGQHGVVPRPKAPVGLPPDHPDGLARAGGQAAAGGRGFQRGAGAVGAGVVHQVQRQGVAAGVLQQVAAGVLQHRSGGPQGLGLVVVGHDGRRQVQCNVLPLHSQSRGLSLMRKSSRSGSKLGFRQGSPAASSAFQRAWKRVTSETKRARFSGASSRPRLLLS